LDDPLLILYLCDEDFRRQVDNAYDRSGCGCLIVLILLLLLLGL